MNTGRTIDGVRSTKIRAAVEVDIQAVLAIYNDVICDLNGHLYGRTDDTR